MNRVKRLLRLRKQDDCVKLALLLFLAAGWLLFTACAQGLAYARMQARPVEYVLESQLSGAVLEVNLQELQALDGVVGLSRQREFSITADGRTLTVTELERQYLIDCYGIELSPAGRQFWLNPAAFANFLGSEPTASARASYQREERTETGEFLPLPNLKGATAFAVTSGSTATLNPSTTLRVMFEHTDPSGATLRKLGKLGFAITNQSEMERRGLEEELALTRFSYALLSALFALAAGVAFLKCSREKRGKREVYC